MEAETQSNGRGCRSMNVFVLEINPREIKLLEINARYMKHEEYNRLVDNIKKDGQLTSTPFLCLDDDKRWLCLSGNHRVRASIDAGLAVINCLATKDPLTKDQRIGIQLSHNAISGQDDMATLKLLYETIESTEYKRYSGLDDKTLELLDRFASTSISEANLRFQTLSMVFLPDELDAAQAIIDDVKNAIKNSDKVWLARREAYDAWLDTQEVISSTYGIKNVATAVELMLMVISHNMEQLSEAWDTSSDEKRWIPIETVIGKSKIPVGSAKVIKRAIDKMVGKGDITSKNLWQALEYLAADYLAE